ncbi:aminoacyl-tRNA hydrolase [Paracoccus suum]|uniref:Peptidyl-tRNA hydrolase n=1 Tax=Paracoccus suum TaxID=2259340 RepID=A0A344PJF2_9RHOB|nr:aminoacyl-tRNA hydrolase [Paracoccus suum]AXC49507.1 aminoacyl-tRNA hydrolase [Paracoccus suum]
MRLIVGLGNPGATYARQRHNIGFMALDEIASHHSLPAWRPRFQGQLAEGRVGDARVALLKPQTFMNLSGQSVGEAMRYLKLQPADVTVFHDELDLAPGQMRVKFGGGHAGHNGLRSIHQHIGEGYGRVRLGIGHPGDKARVTGHVLSDFAKAEGDWLEPLLDAIAREVGWLAQDDPARFQTAVAARLKPARNAGPRDALPEGQPRHAAPRPVPAATPDTPAPVDPLQALRERFR